MKTEADNWYKEGLFWRSIYKHWEYDKYGFSPCGMGDLIFNTMTKIISYNDKSDWAYCSLDACASLLLFGKRWPDDMNNDRISKNGLQYLFSKIRYRIFGGQQLYRPQGSLTRDPYIALYACAVFLGRYQYIDIVKPPWWLYSRNTWRWRRRLLKDNRKDYVIRLGYLRSLANVMKYEKV